MPVVERPSSEQLQQASSLSSGLQASPARGLPGAGHVGGGAGVGGGGGPGVGGLGAGDGLPAPGSSQQASTL